MTAVGRLGHVAVLPLGDKELVQVDLEVESDTFGVEVRDSLAQRVAGMERGSLVRIDGKLARYKWKISGGKERERTVIVAEKVSVIRRPERSH